MTSTIDSLERAVAILEQGYFGIILGEMGEDLPEWAQP